MKLSVILLLASMHLAVAGVKAQAKITVEAKTVTYLELFKQIKEQTGLTVVYSNNELDKSQTVEAGFVQTDLKVVLDRILEGTRLTYEMMDEFIVLKLAPEEKKKSLNIVGRVSDKDKLPLPGVTVMAKDLKLGTTTDLNGFYSLLLPKTDNLSLVFSFMGMKTVEVKYVGQDSINVVMEEDIKALDDVVITGYGRTAKGNYTGAATTVKVADIMMAGASSIDQMLQGVVPGMLVQSGTGMVGSSPKIRVRGTSSLLGSQEPVWVVDGVVQRDPQPFNSEDNTKFSVDADDISQLAGNAISWLNPNDIETITVLKDASATAIYGSEAANGVIVITTKKAKAGKVSVSYSGDFSIGQRPRYGLYDRMNSQEMMEFSKEMYEDRVVYPNTILEVGYAGLLKSYLDKKISKEDFDKEYRKMAERNTDWFDLLFSNSFSHKHSLSLSGGSEKIQNRTSLGYTDERGEAKGNNVALFTATSNTTVNLFDNELMVNLLLKGTWRKAEGFAYDVDPFKYAYNTSRVIPMYNEDGTLHYHDKWAETGSTVINNKYNYLYNIRNELDNTGSENNTKSWGATLDLKWNILPGLEYQGLVSYSSSSADVKKYATERSFYASTLRGYDFEAYENSAEEFGYTRLPFGGLLETGLTDVTTITVRNALVYDRMFKDVHRMTLQLGIETNSTKTRGSTGKRYGYLRDRGETFVKLPMTYKDSWGDPIDNDLAQGEATVLNKIDNKLSEYVSAVYAYDNRYVLNVSARLDASNRFGQDKNKRFEPTWSVGAKWRVASESFAKGLWWLNNLDLIASYGYQGNAVETVSPYLIAEQGGVNEYYNDYVLNVKSLPYSDLGWEKTKTYNFGVDAAFLEGRLNFTVNYFKKVSDVLSSRNIPRENGVEKAIVDGGEMTNTGYDFVINVIPVRTKDFTWQLSLNTAVTKNKVNKNQRINTLNDYLDGSAVVNGEAFSTFYSFKYAGLDDENGFPKFDYMDVVDGESPLAYLVKSGKFTPDFSGGLNMMFKYRNWSLYALFNVQWGGHARLPKLYDTDSNYGIPTPEQNVSRDLAKRWRKAGDKTDIPSIPTSKAYINLPTTATVASSERRLYDMYNNSDLRVANTDFIRCRSLSLSYDFEQKWLSRIGAQRLLLKASMTNPFMWVSDSKWNGLDPETGDWPTRRVTSLSLQVMF
ncbi:SusC/RagA family TonB-linked outer membrane protein [Butyricimonas sp. Marseille-P3923]|uniref:SusC/RagA family TonB-linked outer membrane protein n=1 Tax=Butyricimonas sp. Marseille-P3923 TaxID=1987504 RepID=UPI0021006221|nr:SusC/RagA family TonB-linked outer membrane protein [Butyricimonas sp. Marseille-P3923]